MKKRRNVVVVGANDFDKKNYNMVDYSVNKRFPHYVFLDKIDDVKRLEGFALIVFLDDLNDPSKLARTYRIKFRKFDYIFFYTNKRRFFQTGNLYVTCKYGSFISETIEKLYLESISDENKKISSIKRRNIERLKKYVNDKDYVTSRDIQAALGVSRRWVDRYIEEMDKVYNNVGLQDYYPKKWYIIKR